MYVRLKEAGAGLRKRGWERGQGAIKVYTIIFDVEADFLHSTKRQQRQRGWREEDGLVGTLRTRPFQPWMVYHSSEHTRLSVCVCECVWVGGVK